MSILVYGRVDGLLLCRPFKRSHQRGIHLYINRRQSYGRIQGVGVAVDVVNHIHLHVVGIGIVPQGSGFCISLPLHGKLHHEHAHLLNGCCGHKHALLIGQELALSLVQGLRIVLLGLV